MRIDAERREGAVRVTGVLHLVAGGRSKERRALRRHRPAREDLSHHSGRQATVFYDTKQDHVLCLAVGPEGGLYAGTDKTGRVYRIDARGKGFVLYQAAQSEVRTMILGDDALYVGTSATKRRAASTASLAGGSATAKLIREPQQRRRAAALERKGRRGGDGEEDREDQGDDEIDPGVGPFARQRAARTRCTGSAWTGRCARCSATRCSC